MSGSESIIADTRGRIQPLRGRDNAVAVLVIEIVEDCVEYVIVIVFASHAASIEPHFERCVSHAE